MVMPKETMEAKLKRIREWQESLSTEQIRRIQEDIYKCYDKRKKAFEEARGPAAKLRVLRNLPPELKLVKGGGDD